MKLYLAGPMTGYENYNIPAFKAAKKELEEQGYEIQLPYDIENTAQPDWQWGDYLGEDIRILCNDCGGMVLLPEWERSRGAKLEIAAGLMQSLKFPEFKFYEYYTESWGQKELYERSKESMAALWYDWWDHYSKEAAVA